MVDPFQVLDVAYGTNDLLAKEAWHGMVLKTHPGKGIQPDGEAFNQVMVFLDAPCKG